MLVVGALVSLGMTAEAAAPAGTPNVQVRVGDDTGDVTPELPQDCPRDSTPQWVGNGEGISQSTTGGNNDMDCIRVRILNHTMSTEYSRDFKLCLGLPYESGCTPWASEGGGLSPVIPSADGHIRGAQVYVVDRDMPYVGMKITRVAAGVQFYYRKNNEACKGSSGMVFSGNNGEESGWAFGEQRDNDPGCARIGLQVTQQLPPDAQYVADTVPRTAQASTNYAAQITMRNKGQSWTSDRIIVPEQNNCNPQNDGDTCDDTYTVESTNFVLKRTDETTLTAPATLPYRRVISVHYVRVSGESCEIEPGGGGNVMQSVPTGILARAWRAIAPVAFALPQPGVEICTQYNFVSRSESPLRDVYINTDTDFAVTVGTPATNGTYNLTYRMYKVDAQELFGETATMPITVGTGAGIGLTCQTVSQTISPGQVASYSVSASSINGFSGPVTVRVSAGLPANTTFVSSSMNLAASSTASTIVPVITSSSTPAGTSELTFEATGTGIAPQTCTSELVVRRIAALVVTPSMNRIGSGEEAQYQATYYPFGIASGSGQPVTVGSDWSASIPGVGIPVGSGLFRGVATGTTEIWAAYQGIQASSSLIVGNLGATLTVVPNTASVQVGGQATVAAWYDADGNPSTNNAVNVTTDSAWSSGSESIAHSLNNGTYVGVSSGNTQMQAIYYPVGGGYLTAVGTITVGGGGGASLRLDPTNASVQMGDDTQVRAKYDADGASGPVAEIDVTTSSVWSSDDSAKVSSRGNGLFHGVNSGSAGIHATYDPPTGSPLTADGSVTVGGISLSCTFTANPSSLFIPPLRTTNLNWNCERPASCIVTNMTDSPFPQIATGGQSGVVQPRPQHTTRYQLNCDAGASIVEKTVRVFDVTTRIEILPN